MCSVESDDLIAELVVLDLVEAGERIAELVVGASVEAGECVAGVGVSLLDASHELTESPSHLK